MADAILTGFIILLAVSLVISIVLGIIMLAKKVFGSKQIKFFGIVLLSMGLLNLIFFNVFLFTRFSYKPLEFASLILLFAVPFIEGFALLLSKEPKVKLVKIFGILLILLVLFWIIAAVLSAQFG
jgi:uncharacterized membrane protein